MKPKVLIDIYAGLPLIVDLSEFVKVPRKKMTDIGADAVLGTDKPSIVADGGNLGGQNSPSAPIFNHAPIISPADNQKPQKLQEGAGFFL